MIAESGELCDNLGVNQRQIRNARLLTILFQVLLVAELAGFIISVIQGDNRWGPPSLGIAIIASLAGLWLIRHGHTSTASLLQILGGLVVIFSLAWGGNGIHDVIMLMFPGLILVASMIAGRRGYLITVGLCLISVVILILAEIQGILAPSENSATDLWDLVVIGVIIGVTAVLAWLLSSNLQQSLATAESNGAALAEINRKLAEQTDSLKASEERWRSLVENAPDLIINAQPDGTILFTNGQGGGNPNIVGRSMFDMIPSNEVHRAREIYETVLRTGKPAQAEISGYQQPGLLRWYSVRISPILEDGRVTSLILIINDLTERREADEEIRRLNTTLEERVARRTSELQAKNRELETFTYSVSHDLKAPLRGIDGYTRLLLEDHVDQFDEEALGFLKVIRSAAQQMHQLINDLLEYSRLEQRKVETTLVNPKQMIETVITERSDELLKRQVSVVMNLPPGEVRAEEEGLRQALRNIIDNALKFTQLMEHPEIAIGGKDGDGIYTLWVQDNGIGFDMQYHDRIFEMFQRLNRAEQYPGTGIGLALVSKVMQRSGGRVWAESAPGAGATFYLELPK